jgi:hypothetical protein
MKFLDGLANELKPNLLAQLLKLACEAPLHYLMLIADR